MKKWNKFLLVLLLCVIAGCGRQNNEGENKDKISTKPIDEDGYRIAIPFTSSDATQTHVEYNRGSYDIEAIGKGLQRYSKQYFSTNSYYLQDGQLLKHDDLVSTLNNREALLGRKSKENAFGLNPEKGSTIPISNDQDIKVGSSTITVSDVIEYDFFTDLNENAEIQGVAFAIVLNSTITDADGKEHTIADEQLKIIGEEAGRNLMTYIKDLPEINANTPVMIALFNASSEDANLPGTFLAKAYGKSNIDSFEKINEKWVMIPSDTASEIDPQLSANFADLKDSLFGFLPNDIAVIGKGFFVDDRIDELEIIVTTQGKTQIQNEAVVQYVKEQLGILSEGFKITVNINANTTTFAMLQRGKNSNDVMVIMK